MRHPSLVLLLALSSVGVLPADLDGARQPVGHVASQRTDLLAELLPQDRALRHLLAGGLATERAARLLAEAPESPETVGVLLNQQRVADALRAALQVAAGRPESTADVLRLLVEQYWTIQMDRAFDHEPALRKVMEAARRQAARLPREAAADLLLELTRLDNTIARRSGEAYWPPLRTFAAEYAGTGAATRVELDLLDLATNSPQDFQGGLDALEAFARTHARTCAGAAALVRLASRLKNGPPRARAGQDPTGRFVRVLAIAEQLDDPVYATCKPAPSPVDVASSLYAYQPAYEPGSIDRLIEAYERFVRARVSADSGEPDFGIGYIISNRIPELFRAKKDAGAEMDRFFVQLEKDVAFPDVVAYLRAQHDILGALQKTLDESALQSAHSTLTALASRGRGLYNRKALASLAWLAHRQGDLTRARDLYSRYVATYPESPYAWVATLRAGECAEMAGDYRTAADTYRRPPAMGLAHPVATVLSHAYAARALEALEQFDQALVQHRAALTAWNHAHGDRYGLDDVRPRSGSSPAPSSSNGRLEAARADLEDRVEQLTRTLSAPGGSEVERGRWLMNNGRLREAATLLAGFAGRHPRSANIAEAQLIAHRATLYEALDRLNIEGQADEAAGLGLLDRLSAEPYDFPVCAARITKASVLWRRGRHDEARALLRSALAERVANQPLRDPMTPLERDVAAIRNLVFLPTGGGPYEGARWNGFSWPANRPDFLVVQSETLVKTVDGAPLRISFRQRFPHLDHVLWLDADELAFLRDLMYRVGGTRRREARTFLEQGVMEPPNQPVGPSLDILALLQTSFPTRPGHWGGWEFLTYPDVRSIEFLDAARTTARVPVVIGYSGCTVILEKVDGVWKAVRTANHWVT